MAIASIGRFGGIWWNCKSVPESWQFTQASWFSLLGCMSIDGLLDFSEESTFCQDYPTHPFGGAWPLGLSATRPHQTLDRCRAAAKQITIMPKLTSVVGSGVETAGDSIRVCMSLPSGKRPLVATTCAKIVPSAEIVPW